MAQEAAFILDQLMGRNRDVVPGEGNEDNRHWSDPDVRKSFLVLLNVWMSTLAFIARDIGLQIQSVRILSFGALYKHAFRRW